MSDLHAPALERFAALVAAAKEKEMTEAGWRQCAVGQRTTQFCGQLEQAVVAEREKVAHWMMRCGYATGHGDTLEDLLQELEWQIAENWTRAMVNGAAAEREECATVAALYDLGTPEGHEIAAAIRARGQQ